MIAGRVEPAARSQRVTASKASRLDRVRLGPLERAVLNLLWSTPREVDVGGALQAVGEPRGLSRNTIHSTLERLVRKGLASRRRNGRAYVYMAVVTRTAWIEEVLTAFVGEDASAHREQVLAGFLDFAERTSESTLEVLEGLVRERLRAREEPEEP